MVDRGNSYGTGVCLCFVPYLVGRLLLFALLWRSCMGNCAYNPDSNGHVAIPEGVKEIPDEAFMECAALKSVSIPSSVTRIGDFAFQKCLSLITVNIQEGVTSIGAFAFDDCIALTSIHLPDSVVSIGDYAFLDCLNLQNLFIPAAVYDIGDDIIRNCKKLLKFETPVGSGGLSRGADGKSKILTINGTYEHITAGSFNQMFQVSSCQSGGSGNGGEIDDDDETPTAPPIKWTDDDPNSSPIPNDDDEPSDDGNQRRALADGERHCVYDELIIEEGVKTIQYMAFLNAPFKKVTLPKSLESIGHSAFALSYTTARFPETNTLETSAKKIGPYAFYKTKSIGKIDLTGVEEIADHAFVGSPDFFSSIIFGTSLKKVGASAFSLCKSRTMTSLPPTRKQIEDRSMILPESLEEIGSEGFSGNVFTKIVQINSRNALTLGTTPFALAFTLSSENIHYRKGLRVSSNSSLDLGNMLLDCTAENGTCACKGGYGSDLGKESEYFNCIPCVPGYSSTNPLSTECVPCPKASYSSRNASVICTPCSAGRFGNSTQGKALEDVCFPCNKGTYSPAEGFTECDPCPPGSYCDSTGLSEYEPCDPGKYHDEGGQAEDCKECPAGRYQPGNGSADCDLCPLGKYNAYTGQSSIHSCSDCKGGTYSSQSGTSVCSDCEKGKANNQIGLSGCDDCPNGLTTTGTGQTVCDKKRPCPPGYVSADDGICTSCGPGKYPSSSSECKNCPSGSYSALGNDTSCTLCSAGKYSIEEGGKSEASCMKCPLGKYNPTEGSKECLDCPPGSFCGKVAMSEYQECSPGHYQDEKQQGGAGCKVCPAGRFQNTNGSATCELCPAGTHNPDVMQTSQSESCKACPAGSYSSQDGAANCTSCPEGSFQEDAGKTECFVCSEYYNDPMLTSNPSRTDCMVNDALAHQTLQEAMFASSNYWILIFFVSLVFAGVGVFIHTKRNKEGCDMGPESQTAESNGTVWAKSEGKSGRSLKRMLLIEAVWKSFIPGWHLVSELFLVSFMFESMASSSSGSGGKGAGVGAALLIFRFLHSFASLLFFFAMFGSETAKANVGVNRLLRSARVLFYNIDESFVRENMPAFGALLVLAFADVTLVQFWPWKESLTDMKTFEFYPSRDVAIMCLGVEIIHAVASIFCLGFGLAYVENNERVEALYANIVPLFALTIVITIVRLAASCRSFFYVLTNNAERGLAGADSASSDNRGAEAEDEWFTLDRIYGRDETATGEASMPSSIAGEGMSGQKNPLYARGQEEEEGSDHQMNQRPEEESGNGAIDGRLQALRQEIEGSAQVVERLREEQLMLEEDLLSLEVRSERCRHVSAGDDAALL